jgi:hypothetical protein
MAYRFLDGCWVRMVYLLHDAKEKISVALHPPSI